MDTLQGGCACGAIRFEVTSPPVAVGVCHCLDCQKASGGNPNYVALMPAPAFTLVQGAPKVHESTGQSGATVGRAFCGDCGTPLWSVPVHEPFVPIKLGAFDSPPPWPPNMHLYVRSAAPWHLMHESLPQFPEMPPRA